MPGQHKAAIPEFFNLVIPTPNHGEVCYPYSFILYRDRSIHKIYNGWWFWGRPTCEDIRQDLRAVMSKRDDWVYPDE